jgi:hypothetical protein
VKGSRAEEVSKWPRPVLLPTTDELRKIRADYQKARPDSAGFVGLKHKLRRALISEDRGVVTQNRQVKDASRSLVWLI